MHARLIHLLLVTFFIAECFAQSNAPTRSLGPALAQELAEAKREAIAAETQQKNTGTMLSQATITGIVKPAAWSANEAATVQAKKALYMIVKDAKGKIVARDAVGKKVEIKGTVTECDGIKWITVIWCALVE